MAREFAGGSFTPFTPRGTNTDHRYTCLALQAEERNQLAKQSSCPGLARWLFQQPVV